MKKRSADAWWRRHLRREPMSKTVWNPTAVDKRPDYTPGLYVGVVTHSYDGPDYGPKYPYPNQAKKPHGRGGAG